MHDFRLPPRCKSALRSSGILGSVEWQFCADFSGQSIDPIFKAEEVQALTALFLDFLTAEDGKDRLFRNVATELRLYAA
jgi:hypothetical protein